MSRPGPVLDRWLSWGLLAIVVAGPTQYSIEVAKKTYLSVVDPLVWLVLLAWLAGLWRTKRLGDLKAPPLFLLLFLLTCALSLARATQRLTACKDIFQAVEYLVAVFMLFSHGLLEGKTRRRVLHVFLAVGTAVILLGLAQYLSPSVSDFRVRGTFENANVFGGYLAIVLPLMYGLLLFERAWGRRLWLLAAILAGLAVNLSGGTCVALILSLALVSALKGQKALLAFLVLLLAGALLLVPALPRDNGEKLVESISLYGPDSAPAPRYTEWQAALDMARENPLLGVGIGNYQANIGMYYGTLPNPTGPSLPDTQNLYLVLAGSVGFAGLACFAGMLLFFGRRALAAYFRPAPGAAEPATPDTRHPTPDTRHPLSGGWTRRFRRWMLDVRRWAFDSEDSESRSTEGTDRGLALGLLGSLVAFSINSLWSPLFERGIGVPLAIVFALAASCARHAIRPMDSQPDASS